ncbi:MAG TPA: gamma-glutamyltransferase [Alphaproteobacteria bacterium]|jgi:gamma-glutamyltranspeptidase/glutathione hydrolase
MTRLYRILAASLLMVAAPAWAETERAPESATGATKKPPVYAKRFMAVSANPEATRAAYQVLKSGGSAADAAVAAQLVLNLVEPQSSGIGGGGFILYWDNKAKRLHAYDGRETAPAGAKPEIFLREGRPMPFLDAVRGGHAVGVPGIPALLEHMHKRHGKLAWAALFRPAQHLAEQGFPVSARLHQLIAATPTLKERAEPRLYFFTDGDKPLPAGHVLKNIDFHATITRIANGGAQAFYRGPVADAVVASVREVGGTLAPSDLAGYKVEEREPVCALYIGFRVCSMGPPSSGGIAVLQILAILERFPNEIVAAEDERAAHLFVEAQRLAFADRNLYVADPAFVRVPVKGLVDRDYLAGRAKLIDRHRALGKIEAGTPPENKGEFAPDTGNESPGTSHLSIVDGEGNAVSFTTTIENGFGAQMMAGGFLLNNQLTDFAFVPERDGKPVANRVEPGKRPRSSMAPVMVFDKDDRLILVVGSPGGARIIGYVARTVMRVLDGGSDIAAAVAEAHVVSTGTAAEIEKGTDAEQLAERLERLGHKVVVRELNSGLHGIQITDDRLIGGADPRREGTAMGE